MDLQWVENISDQSSESDADNLDMEDKAITPNEIKSYEIKATEGRINEELLYQNTRKKKLK